MKQKIINKPNFNDIKFNNFEILFYSLRFCLNTKSDINQNEKLYFQIISPDIEKNLKEICIPGNNFLDNIYLDNYDYLKNHLITENKPANIGAYICSCGIYYEVAPNGFLYSQITCCNCGKNINPSSEIKIPYLPNYYRIFKDNNQKNSIYSEITGADAYKNVPNMLLEEYKRDKIDPILEANKFGIIKVNKIFFMDKNKKVRNLSNICYRILNFILYSYLFCANCLGFISDENIQKYICDEMTCFDMLEIDWNFLKDELRKKGILNIHIFMDIIFDNFYQKVISCKKLKSLEERDKFEEECEKLLDDSFQKYEAYLNIYKKK